MKIIYTIILVLVIIFVISFSLQNATDVPIKFYDLFNVSVPAYLLMFIAFLLGVIFTGILDFAERMNLTRTIRQLNKTIRDLKRELRSAEDTMTSEERTGNDRVF